MLATRIRFCFLIVSFFTRKVPNLNEGARLEMVSVVFFNVSKVGHVRPKHHSAAKTKTDLNILQVATHSQTLKKEARGIKTCLSMTR